MPSKWVRLPLIASAAALVSVSALVSAAWADDTPSVVVTIKPLHALVAGVMEGVAAPTLLIEGAQSPHSFALKPSQAAALNEADFVFLADGNLEAPITRIAGSLPKGVQVVPLIEAPGVTPLKLRGGVAFEAHDHGPDGHAHSAHSHGHKDHGHDDHGHDDHHKHDHDVKASERDPHFWLDPAHGRAVVARVATLLSERFPDHGAVFKANAERINARLSALEDALSHRLEAVRAKPFLVFHDAYQYFERHFGLQAAGSITANPEVLPGARRLAELRTRLSESGAVCVFSEPQFQARVIDTVIEGSSVKRGVIDPLGADVAAGPLAYDKTLTAMALAFEGCLAGGDANAAK